MLVKANTTLTGWASGQLTVCKTVYTGSNPVLVSKIKTMKDKFGTPLAVGDKVVYLQSWGNTVTFAQGTIQGLDGKWVIMETCKRAPHKVLKHKW